MSDLHEAAQMPAELADALLRHKDQLLLVNDKFDLIFGTKRESEHE